MDVSMTKLVFEAKNIEWKAVDRAVNVLKTFSTLNPNLYEFLSRHGKNTIAVKDTSLRLN